ncbi:S-layer protein domain-containing protein [Methanosalsum zhilinae]|nr:S-layer protein domain-containing protein [Methanosalsum zhilinae]
MRSVKTELLLKYLVIAVILLTSLTVVFNVADFIAAASDDNEVPENEALINGTGIYLQTGEEWDRFYQGYSLRVKYVNFDQKSLWIELLLNETTVKEKIMYEGEKFIYSQNSVEIFNITVDRIYSGAGEELVTFRPVYQFKDPSLPPPSQEPGNNNASGDNNGTNNDETPVVNGFGIKSALISVIIASICIMGIKFSK